MNEKTKLLDEYPPSSSRQRRASSPLRNRYSVAILCLVGVLIIRIVVFSIFWISPERTRVTSISGSGAARVLAKNPLIDGHNDFPILVRVYYNGEIDAKNFTAAFEDGGLPGMVDAPRLEGGMVGGQFWSAFVPCPANVTDYSDENYGTVVRWTLEQVDLIHRLSAKYPKYFTIPANAAEAEHNWSKHGKLIAPLAIEGLHQIGNSPATLRLLHKLGVRYATLTWNCHNKYADAALISSRKGTVKAEPLHHGVSEAGQALILEMNRLGMLVDLSHVSVDTMRDVLGGNTKKGWKGSIAPPIFSHSSAHGVCPHPRNVPDDILHLVKARNSVVMVNFSPDFVSCRLPLDEAGLPTFVNETNTLAHVVEHIMYIGKLIGYDHVGLGSDFDGIESTPRGLEDVAKYPDLVQALLDAGVSEEDAGKVVGRNLLRVWKEADRVAAKLQKTMKPLVDVDDHMW